MKIELIKPNKDNPRVIRGNKFDKLVNSIKEFPEMLKLRPIVIDEDNIILGGNMRYKACVEAGLKDIPVKVAKGLTEAQKKEFIIKDNVGFGEWDWDLLANDWNEKQIEEWGLDVWQQEEIEEPQFDELNGEEKDNNPSIKITFKSYKDLENAEIEIQELISKYKDSFYSVS